MWKRQWSWQGAGSRGKGEGRQCGSGVWSMQARRPINSQKWKRRLRWVLPLLLFCFWCWFFCWFFCRWLAGWPALPISPGLLLAQLCEATELQLQSHINRKECEEMQNANTTNHNTTTFQMHSWCLPFKCAQLLLLLLPVKKRRLDAGRKEMEHQQQQQQQPL